MSTGNQGLEVASSSALCFGVMEKQWKLKEYDGYYRDHERFVVDEGDEFVVVSIFHLHESS